MTFLGWLRRSCWPTSPILLAEPTCFKASRSTVLSKASIPSACTHSTLYTRYTWYSQSTSFHGVSNILGYRLVVSPMPNQTSWSGWSKRKKNCYFYLVSYVLIHDIHINQIHIGSDIHVEAILPFQTESPTR